MVKNSDVPLHSCLSANHTAPTELDSGAHGIVVRKSRTSVETRGRRHSLNGPDGSGPPSHKILRQHVRKHARRAAPRRAFRRRPRPRRRTPLLSRDANRLSRRRRGRVILSAVAASPPWPPSSHPAPTSTRLRRSACSRSPPRPAAAWTPPPLKTAASSLIGELIAANPNPEPAASPTCSIDGDWELIYSDTFLFRSSPFFWAVGSMMGDTADFFYQAHSHQTGIFGGGVGRVVQTVDTKGGRLISDSVVKASVGLPLLGFSPIFAGYGSVITAGRCAAKDGTRLAVTAETTTVRQDDANVLPQLNFLNGTTVPVEDVMKQVGGGEAGPEVYLDTFYLDDEMRISKLEDGSVFVYQRC